MPSHLILDRADAFLDLMLPAEDEEEAEDENANAEKACHTETATGKDSESATDEASEDHDVPFPEKDTGRQDAFDAADLALGQEVRKMLTRTRRISHELQIRAYVRGLRQAQTARQHAFNMANHVIPYIDLLV